MLLTAPCPATHSALWTEGCLAPSCGVAAPGSSSLTNAPFSPGNISSELMEAPERRVHVPIPQVCECALVGRRSPQWRFS